MQQRRIGTGESVLRSWVGDLVVVKYLAGPDEPVDLEDPKSLAHAELETRSGIFHLQRFSQLGIEVCNEMEDGLLNRVTFLPWSSVLSIDPRHHAGGAERARGQANEGAGGRVSSA